MDCRSGRVGVTNVEPHAAYPTLVRPNLLGTLPARPPDCLLGVVVAHGRPPFLSLHSGR